MTPFDALLAQMGVANPTAWGQPLLAACRQHEINTPLRMAALLANMLYETTTLTRLRESLDYSPAGLINEWPSRFPPADAQRMGRIAGRPADQPAIANRAYGGRLGNGPESSNDGWLFRGGGGLMTTARSNYATFARLIGWTRPIEQLPDYLATLQGAVDSAASYFAGSGCNALADAGDVAAVRRRIQGGTRGLAEVTKRYGILLSALHGAVRAAAPPSPEPELITADDLNSRELTRIRSAA